MTSRIHRARRPVAGAARRAAALGVAGLFLALPGCGGESSTGPGNGGGDPVLVELDVGGSQVVSQPQEGPLSFTLSAPDAGASYRLAVQSAAESGAGATAMRLTLGDGGGGGAADVAARVIRSGYPIPEITPEQRGLTWRHRMRERAWRKLARLGVRGSSGYDVSAPRLSLLPAGEVPQQGDQLRFRFPLDEQGSITCDTTVADTVVAEVQAVGQRVAMVVDTAVDETVVQDMNYDSLATAFDEAVFGAVSGYFGSPTDIDGNERVYVLFAGEVNRLSEGQEGGIVAGFFAPSDLADSGGPQTGGAEATFEDDGVCEAGNEAEIMWLVAPDPNDEFGGGTIGIDRAKRLASNTSAHEFQHMLNAGNRIIKRSGGFGNPSEATWLDEGLSHVAEEIVGLAEIQASLRDNLGPSDVLGSEAEAEAFNTFQISNFGNGARFLSDPAGTRALALEDPALQNPPDVEASLKMRGFGWLFLRWLADQEAPSSGGQILPGAGEEELFGTLAANPEVSGNLNTGIANVEEVTGEEFEELLADFGAAMAVDDDVDGGSSRQQVLTWNLRAVYGELNSQLGDNTDAPFGQPYPLQITEQGFSGATADFEVRPGGGRYFEVSTQSGGEITLELTDQAGARLTAGSPQVTIVRVQ